MSTDHPAAQREPIRREHLMTADLSGRADRIDRVETYLVTLPPGVATGLHTHPGGVAGYLTGGRVVFQIEGQPAQELRAGSAFYEPAGATILRFDNLSGTGPVSFVGCYLLTGAQPLIQPL
jgi:quercetin dioxygenase-like cupin family protein